MSIPSQSKMIPGKGRFYRVDVHGQVWSCKSGQWKRMCPSLNPKTGYLLVFLNCLPCYVHHLVLLAFVGPCPKGCEARHFPDKTRSNNSVSNLKWGTRKENAHDRFAQGTDFTGEKSPCTTLTWRDVERIRKLHCSGKRSPAQLRVEYGMSVGHIIRNRSWRKANHNAKWLAGASNP